VTTTPSISPGSQAKARAFTFIELFEGIGSFHWALNALGGEYVFIPEKCI